MMSTSHLPARCVLYLALLIVFIPCSVVGATIAEVGTVDILEKAEVIFDGVVTDVRTSRIGSGNIHTTVTFEVLDVIKGTIPAGRMRNFTLRFTGGTYEAVTMDVGIQYPQAGERGVYFIERVAPGLLNPLIGWDQGHFTIDDDGSITAGNGEKVSGVDRADVALPGISRGVARGITTSPSGIAGEVPAMDVQSFKFRIRTLLGEAAAATN